MWTLHPDFQEMVQLSWNEDVDTNCPIFKVMTKLKRLRARLKDWNRNTFRNVDVMLAEQQQDLLEVQTLISENGYSDELFNKEIQTQARINVTLTKKACFLQQKSRVKWLQDGDRNTSFFHNMLRYKRLHRNIESLEIDGNIVHDEEAIARHVTQFFSNLFQDPGSIDRNIVHIEAILDHVISDIHNDELCSIPDEAEIMAAVFDMDAMSAPGPDGFSGKFFQSCWSIIKDDVITAVRMFFLNNYLPSGCNANTLILIPKKENITTVMDLRPIVLSNFFFKIIAKVLAVRLSKVAAAYVTRNQFGFIQGRSIHDCIMLGSEGVNCMRRTNKGLNMACKIDIKKAFDTLNWDFLINVLKVLGFQQRFVDWINVILHSARISILCNGNSWGYFACSRGVRQGDPLSPILFGIAEDVLSCLFQNCVSSGHLAPMMMTKLQPFPTHLFYADDILIFCKASIQNAITIKRILGYYGDISGQICSVEKSFIYFGDKVPTQLRRPILNSLHFAPGLMPFNYLGVPIFQGRARALYFRAIHDRIINKFSRWKGRHLSMAGRLCLIKSVIQSSVTHSMLVYRWPKALIKDLDAKCRNFLWTGSTLKKATCTVSWSRVCASKGEGGLGVRSFEMMNKCFLMKLAWKIIKGKEFGYNLMNSRYLNAHSRMSSTTASSSIWLGIRHEIDDIVDDTYCHVGSGHMTNFWLDDWLGYVIAEKCGLPTFLKPSFSVADYFFEGVWHFTQEFINNYPEIVCDILLIPIGEGADTRFWKPATHGEVTAKLASKHHGHRHPSVLWGNWIWAKYIPERRSITCWRIIHNRLPTHDRLIKHGMIMPNYCTFCFQNAETIDHIFWKCSQIEPLWKDFFAWFRFEQALASPDIHSMLVYSWNRKLSPQIGAYWKLGIITMLWTIWNARNLCIFENAKWNKLATVKFIRSTFLETEKVFPCMGHIYNSWEDYIVLRQLGVASRAAPPPETINVHWWPPATQWMKVNTDGSALGSPGKIAAGGVFRDNWAWVRGCFHVKGGIGYAFEAELLAVIYAIRIAHRRSWLHLWVESDSAYIVHILHNRITSVPWRYFAAWREVLRLLEDFNLQITHIYREGNKAADIMANDSRIEGWWPHEINEIKNAVRMDMAVHSHLRIKM
ncbi:uncharacterized protein LOC131023144 [Salvia miltiorrhiza]|uniref:uncharacterized protein LOC131023144 n=1 Tax=Salvia miltiorrhiza TaxID=226208 RepID=UPI0025AC9355|nr:uncharacterized protein LOC131023144 [Salvia miltiorrhiza]